MTITTAFHMSSVLLAATGMITLIVSVELTPLWLVFACVVVVLSMVCLMRGQRLAKVGRAKNLMLSAVIGITLVDLAWISNSLFFALVHFLVLFLCSMLLTLESNRDYFYLYGISFLHLMCAAAMTVSLTYAVSVLIYLVLAVWTLMLYHLHQALASRSDLPAVPSTAQAGAGWDAVPAGTQGDVWNRASGQRPETAELEHVLNQRFMWITNSIAVMAFLVMVLLFASIPRIGAGFIQQSNTEPIAVSGFSETVNMGAIGKIKRDPTIVMRVELPDHDGPVAQLYFRGVAFDEYHGRSWRNTQPERRAIDWEYGRWRDIQGGRSSELIQQDIILEPINSPVLFGASDVKGLEGRFRAVHRDDMDSFFLPHPPQSRVKYTVYSAPARIADEDFRRQRSQETYRSGALERWLQVPPALNRRVNALAESIVRGKSTIVEQVREILSHLRNNKNFTYSLDAGSAVETPPVEDFLFGRKIGYCEHYASAMVMLVRTLGIPARMVAGFLPGEWNEFGKYYAVRQQDAHTWVEVYLPSSGWVTFDPTPSGDVPAAPTILDKAARMLDAIRHAWDRYVIAYSFSDQATAVVKARNVGRRIAARMLDIASGWKETALSLGHGTLAGIDSLVQAVAGQPGTRTTIVGMVVVLLAVGGAAYWRLLRRVIARDSMNAPAVESYTRMLRILKKRGLRKEQEWTPFEFARVVEVRARHVAPLVREMTHAYCRSRFGHHPMTQDDSRRMIDLLGVLRSSEFPAKSH